MLKRVGLKNFKLHENTAIDARRITVFIGPNNSGKSSIFQALLALRQAALKPNNSVFLQTHQREDPKEGQPYLYRSGAVVDLGEFQNVLRKGSDAIQIQVHGEVGPNNSLGKLAEQVGAIEADFVIRIRNNQLTKHRGSLKFWSGRVHAEWMWDRTEPEEGEPVVVHLPTHNQLTLSPLATFAIMQEREDEATLVADVPVNILKSLRPVFPLRGFEEWGYPIADSTPQGTLDRLTLSDRAVALTNALASNLELKEQLSERLEELLGLKIDFETVSGRRIRVWARASKTRGAGTLFVNEGTGANQLPFILVPIALAPPDETILLSEPEAHLHPKMQSQLMTFILKVSKDTPLQFFIETHSEHVLHRVLHAVARKELGLEDLAIYYFEAKDGKATAKPLEIDEHGGVKGGLPGFFDQDLDELSEYLEALKGSKG